jgi:hypothetical protein
MAQALVDSYQILRTVDVIDEGLVGGIGKRGEFVRMVLNRTLGHLEFVRVNETLILLELQGELLHV